MVYTIGKENGDVLLNLEKTQKLISSPGTLNKLPTEIFKQLDEYIKFLKTNWFLRRPAKMRSLSKKHKELR